MKVYSLNPNNSTYFLDDSEFLYDNASFHMGNFRRTPIYPLFTFSSSGRTSYENHENQIKYVTMLPITRFFKKYLVEVHFTFILNENDQNSLNKSIDEFKKFCQKMEKEINVDKLIKL